LPLLELILKKDASFPPLIFQLVHYFFVIRLNWYTKVSFSKIFILDELAPGSPVGP
jgi:hypothetical protein